MQDSISADSARILFRRVKNLRVAILWFLGASVVDIAAVSGISAIYNVVSTVGLNELVILAFGGLALVLARTGLVFQFRKLAFEVVMQKKILDESSIVAAFISRRVHDLQQNENSSITEFKEGLVNSSQLAVVNFDIPVAMLFGEIFFTLGALIMLFNGIGSFLFWCLMPIGFFTLFLMRIISAKLRAFGSAVLRANEARLLQIDNLAESSSELSVANRVNFAVHEFEHPNIELTNVLKSQLSLGNSVQLVVESVAIISVFVCFLAISLGFVSVSASSLAATLAVLARLVPTITRSIASATQLHYGIPAVLKLHASANRHK